MDQHGRRLHPQIAGTKDQFAIFLGCSFVFGVSVQETETLPFYFEKIRPNYKSYNYGVSGYGTHQILAQVRSIDWSLQIEERNGIFIMIAIPQHIFRSSGHSQTVGSRFNDPCYAKDDLENMKYVGTRCTNNPIRSRLNALINSISVPTVNGLIPLSKLDPITENQVDYDCNLTYAIQKKLLKLYPKSKFAVVFHPQYDSYYKRQVECLKKHHVKHLIFSDQFHLFERSLAPDRAHPSASSNKMLAKMIISELEL